MLELEQRALVLAPTGRDAPLIVQSLLRGGIAAEAFGDAAQLVSEARQGVGMLVVAEEALSKVDARARLQQLIDEQPAWSDLPLLLLVKPGGIDGPAAPIARAMGNVTMLQRPMPSGSLVSAVRTALRMRARQYVTRTADRRKDEFLAMLAHELRNPLAPMSNALHLLRRESLPEVHRAWSLDVMGRQLDQLTRLVDDLLDVARITQGKVELQREEVGAQEVVRNATEISTPLIEAMAHTLHTELPAASVRLHVDPVRLAQCISNLLNNAAKYTPRGGHITLRATTEGTTFELSVADDGVGIPTDALPRLFDIFAQVEGSRQQAQGGLGIGLSLVKAFVELHGGSVEAHSEGSGRGSRFTLRLPGVVVAGSSEGEGLSQAPARPRGPRRILVVDDNSDSADSLSMLLQASGYEVRTAYDGLSAFELAVGAPPDMAILDIGLPDIDGYQLATRLRAQPTLRGLTLVALSGWGQRADRERAAEAGFDHHLTKPADPGDVLALIAADDTRA